VDVLVVTSMYPDGNDPVRGRFVADQVAALRALGDASIEVFSFPPGAPSYPRAAADLRRRYGRRRFDLVHAHFGLTAWPALAVRAGARVVTLHGTDLHHPRSRAITAAVLPRYDLVATVSRTLAAQLPASGRRRPAAVLPVGVDVDRFRPMARAAARAKLGLDPDGRYVLFPADPARAIKRFDRAQAAAAGAELLTLGGIEPDEVPLWVNAANVVVVTSDAEGFGLAALEALACDVPVISTPVGIAPVALGGVPGARCMPFDAEAWRAALAPVLADPDARARGRERALLVSAARMAARVPAAWRGLV
jgi:teichuronic acid biosynthesis glycosyltransferase TuaC